MARRQHQQRARIFHCDLAEHLQQQRFFALERAAGYDDGADILAFQRGKKCIDDCRLGVRLHFKLQVAADMHAIGRSADLDQPLRVFLTLRQEHINILHHTL